jgi:hypothetical protein
MKNSGQKTTRALIRGCAFKVQCVKELGNIVLNGYAVSYQVKRIGDSMQQITVTAQQTIANSIMYKTTALLSPNSLFYEILHQAIASLKASITQDDSAFGDI